MDLKEFWDELNAPGNSLLEQRWPENKRFGFLDALREILPDAHTQLAKTHRIVREFGDKPILAVAGPINSGKSSLVGTFLTEENRGRIPIGLSGREGTQRFVLWIPRAWEQEEAVYTKVEEMLTLVFEAPPERLPEAPEEARRRYADAGGFSRPLIAADDRLDRHGVALMDCPDMQRRQTGEREGENLRLEAIVKASELCAGVVIVAPRSQLEIRDLTELVRRRLPQAVRVYAVNLIRPPEPPEEVYAELRQALGDGDEAPICYGAYDFMVPSSQDFIPAWDDSLSRPEEARAPCFFLIAPEPERNRPENVEPDRSILRLAERIRPAMMRQKRRRELLEDLDRQVRQGVEALEKRAEADRERLTRAAEELYVLARGLMHDADGRLRIKVDSTIVLSFKESMERTAPIHLKPVMALRRRMVDRAAEVVGRGRDAIVRAFPWMRAGGGRYEAIKSRLQKRLIQEEDIRKLLDRWAVAAKTGVPERTWDAEARDILERYRVEESSNMCREDWDRITRRIWKTTGRMRATVTIFGSFFIGLAAEILIPFDGGASVLGITALELLGVLGFSGLIAGGTLKLLEEEMKVKIGYRQFANFLAIAGDRLGIPRETVSAILKEHELFEPAMDEAIPARTFGVSEAGWRLCRIDPRGRKAIFGALKQLNEEKHVAHTA